MKLLKDLIEWKTSDLERSIFYHKKYNQPLNIFDDGFTEMLHACMYDTTCTGTGGSGWDTLDKGESKNSNRVQSHNCKKCDSKMSFFIDICLNCGSREFKKYPKDSRWGIDASAHLKYLDDIKEYRLCLIEPLEWLPSCRLFRIR
jgi:hypothetical protein